MKFLAGLFSIAFVLISFFIGWHIMMAVVPQYVAIWWMGVLFYILFIVAKALED
jgi:hypothetical protein